ncbi:MAG: hypothetical protein RLP44_29060 [Aggregatilineales bacterium]
MSDQNARFETIILRAWQEPGHTQAGRIWRFRLQDVRTGKQITLSTIDALLRYLSNTFNDDSADDTPQS